MNTTTIQPPLPPPTLPAPRRSGTAFKILLSLAVLAVAVAGFTIASLALFTDSESVGGNTFVTGSVDLTASPATAVVAAPSMVPGDQVTATIDVGNGGTVPLRYALTSTTTENVLAGELVMTVKSGVTTCDDANWGADGTELYSGVLGTTGTTAVFGDVTQGAQAGDRTLAAAATETLCINVSFPLAATNASQNLTTTATLDFSAEQTANNP